ncbi:response regulator [Algoriphagus aestuariicola]|uniref:histidine kinase n=1 Tax=Algoriphagus aestuariicola TaxID=1852016 RepID=A0ABS3BPV6_9BACT|nr:PAS domain-containing hybrid sensor histidine kinase/response regulator [Algoriphagus aestuariicola]MBN7801332.1 response regulator [Algoriphagus aestuariicola]
MQDKGINSTFKKIIFESSEMVFLADDTYPYSIFYANESFEELIGGSLTDRSLVGLGLDINAYIFKEELILSHDRKDFSFKLELPQDSGSNYFLFYKGKEIKTHGLPSKKESYQFFTSKLDLIGIGKSDYFTYLNPAVLPVLGYGTEELLNTNLCHFIHENDIQRVRDVWKSHQKSQGVTFLELRFKRRDGAYRHLECSVQFNPDCFFVIARDISNKVYLDYKDKKLLALREKMPGQAKVGNWKLNLEKKTLDLEPAAEAIFSSLYGKPYEESELKDRFSSQVLKQVSTLAPASVEFEGVIGVSEVRELAFSAFVHETNPREIWGLVWDDSEQQALRKESDMRLKLWLECPEAMMIVESDGKVFLANREANQLFGFEESKSILHLDELNDLLSEPSSWSQWLFSSSNDGAVSRFSSYLTGPDAVRLPLEIASKEIQLEGKNYVTLSFRNISEKISLEKKVEASSDFLVNLTEQVPGGLYQLVLNAEGQMNFSFLSKGINTVLGLSKEEIHQFTDISSAIAKVHPQDLPLVIMSSIASARKMEPWQCQFRVKSGNAGEEYRWVLGAARPQAMDTGDMVWYGYLTDISKQKEFEAKLDEARMAAEKANQIKSDFLSMISHELRTPLNAISGSVYSLFHESPTESQKPALDTINFAVDNLIIMINDLLDFQKIEAGKLTIEPSPMNLKGLLEQVIKGLTFHAKDSKNSLELQIPEELDIIVRADKTRLSQIMNNLITNALKFTNEGSVQVKVELLKQIRNKVRVLFSVQDTGIGIAPEHQERVFDDFDQVRPTFSSKYGGTGLGLSITRKLLNLMGGKIQLESEVGKGSRFYFELEMEIVQESIKPDNGSDQAESFEGLHLLMAEDNEVNSLVLGKIIRKWGYTFTRVHNGSEAVEAARNGDYDCILMDIQMPVMDGFDATLEIKKFSDTPIIALTAAAKLEIMERIDECEFEGFVAKPIDANELLKKVKEVTLARNYKA